MKIPDGSASATVEMSASAIASSNASVALQISANSNYIAGSTPR